MKINYRSDSVERERERERDYHTIEQYNTATGTFSTLVVSDHLKKVPKSFICMKLAHEHKDYDQKRHYVYEI